jgi:hypothetical protein
MALSLHLSATMLQRAKYIISFLVLVIYLTSTIGLVVFHYHCFCEAKEHSSLLFHNNQNHCSYCDTHQDTHEQACCSLKDQGNDHQNQCCSEQAVYLKLTADYNVSKKAVCHKVYSSVIMNFSVREEQPESKPCYVNRSIKILKLPDQAGLKLLHRIHQLKIEPSPFIS